MGRVSRVPVYAHDSTCRETWPHARDLRLSPSGGDAQAGCSSHDLHSIERARGEGQQVGPTVGSVVSVQNPWLFERVSERVPEREQAYLGWRVGDDFQRVCWLTERA